MLSTLLILAHIAAFCDGCLIYSVEWIHWDLQSFGQNMASFGTKKKSSIILIHSGLVLADGLISICIRGPPAGALWLAGPWPACTRRPLGKQACSWTPATCWSDHSDANPAGLSQPPPVTSPSGWNKHLCWVWETVRCAHVRTAPHWVKILSKWQICCQL